MGCEVWTTLNPNYPPTFFPLHLLVDEGPHSTKETNIRLTYVQIGGKFMTQVVATLKGGNNDGWGN